MSGGNGRARMPQDAKSGAEWGVDPTVTPFAPRDAMERSILASCMLYATAPGLAIRTLGAAGMFTNPTHDRIWRAIVSLSNRGLTVDYTTVITELSMSATYTPEVALAVIHAADALVYSGHVSDYCEQLLTMERRAVLHEAATELRGVMAQDVLSPDELLQLAGRVADAARRSMGAQGPEPVGDALSRVVDAMGRGVVRGVDTGYGMLDNTLRGMKPGELHIIAARPGVGKTALALNIALNVATAAQPVVFFSLEMDSDSIVQRMVSAALNTSKPPLTAVRGAIPMFRAAQLYLDCTPSITLDGIYASLTRHTTVYGKPALVLVDYLQLVRVPGHKSRWEEVGAISRGLKAMAGEFGCCVMAAAQLSRESEKAARPMLSHLRESGSIEQDADVVILMNMQENSKDMLELAIAKNRHGETSGARLVYDKATQRIRPFGVHAAPVTAQSVAVGDEEEFPF